MLFNKLIGRLFFIATLSGYDFAVADVKTLNLEARSEPRSVQFGDIHAQFEVGYRGLCQSGAVVRVGHSRRLDDTG